jgi:hypothetical protein
MRVVAEGGHSEASIVVVSDFRAGEDASWSDVAETLDSLATQTCDEPVEVLLVCAADEAALLPPDLLHRLPGTRLVEANGSTSYDLKNEGAVAARASIVLLLDADCMPLSGWLEAALRHLRQHPAAAVVSGRTVYKGTGPLRRVAALLDRAYVDPGCAGPTRSISNNNAAFRREALLRHPLRNDIGPFGARPHADAMLAAGDELRFEPGMVTAHGFDGWPMLRDIRFGQGFAVVRYRQLHPEARYGTVVGLGYLGLPILLGASIARSWWDCLRLRRAYGVGLASLPLALGLALLLRAYELRGMIAALRRQPVGAEASAYR